MEKDFSEKLFSTMLMFLVVGGVVAAITAV